MRNADCAVIINPDTGADTEGWTGVCRMITIWAGDLNIFMWLLQSSQTRAGMEAEKRVSNDSGPM